MFHLVISRGFLRRNVWTVNRLFSFAARSDVMDKGLPTNESSKALTGDVRFIKRKVALVCSFVGSNYRGMQFNKTIETIESALVKCLTEIGCILPSNSLDPTKIGWSRSSRTDKGVHAARLIVAAKLEVHPEWIDEETRKSIEVPRLVNEQLPPDIRVFSCVRVNGGFNARYDMDWREYEYVVPLDILTLNKNDHHTSEHFLSKLNTQLMKMEGTHSFHNFHHESLLKQQKPKRKDYNVAVEPIETDLNVVNADQTKNDQEEEDDDDDDNEEEKEEEGEWSDDKTKKSRVFDVSKRYLEAWEPVTRPTSPRIVKTMFRVRASLFDLPSSGAVDEKSGQQTMIRIVIRGS